MSGLDHARRLGATDIDVRAGATPCLRRLEWNGVSGWREVEIRRVRDERDPDHPIERHEHPLGEVAEPLS